MTNQLRDWEISNLIESLHAHAQHIRAHEKAPRRYASPVVFPDTLERAADLIQHLTGIEAVRPVWEINRPQEATSAEQSKD